MVLGIPDTTTTQKPRTCVGTSYNLSSLISTQYFTGSVDPLERALGHARLGFTFGFHDMAVARFWGSHRSLICPLLPSGTISALLRWVVVWSASDYARDNTLKIVKMLHTLLILDPEVEY